jgi:hypothetical protein
MNMNELSAKYGSLTLLRAAIQCIPNFGGAIDTLLSSQGAKWQEDRINQFMTSLDADLNSLKNKNFLTEEKFFECLGKQESISIIVGCIRESIQAIENEKVELFSNIAKNYLAGQKSYVISDIDSYIRTTKELTTKEFEYFLFISKSSPYEHIISDFGTYLHPEKIYAKPMKIRFGFQEDIEDDWKVKQDEIDTVNVLVREQLIKDKHSDQGCMPISGHGIFSDFFYKDKIRYELSDYGKKYLEWVT